MFESMTTHNQCRQRNAPAFVGFAGVPSRLHNLGERFQRYILSAALAQSHEVVGTARDMGRIALIAPERLLVQGLDVTQPAKDRGRGRGSGRPVLAAPKKLSPSG